MAADPIRATTRGSAAVGASMQAHGRVDAEAFAALYERYRVRLYAFCLARTRDATRAEDMVHDVFEKAFAARAQFDPTREFWPWLSAIATRECVDAYRRRAYKSSRFAVIAAAARAQSPEAVEATVVRQIERERLERKIAKLPPRQRSALQLFALDGWTYAEIAGHFGESVAVVKALLARARAHLRDVGAGSLSGVAATARWWRDRAQRLVGRLTVAAGSYGDALRAASDAWATGAVAFALALFTVNAAVGVDAPRPPHRQPPVAVAPPESLESRSVPATTSTVAVEPAVADVAQWEEPAARSVVGEAERVAHELTRSIAGGPDPVDPETARTSSIAVSPEYERDHTVLVAGQRSLAFHEGFVLASTDGGASWQERRALGLDSPKALLFSPRYARDRLLFAVTGRGLQASTDGGDTFETLVPLTGLDDASVSPSFDGDAPSVLLVVGGRLFEYHHDTGLVQVLPLDGVGPDRRVHAAEYVVDENGMAAIAVVVARHNEYVDPYEFVRCMRSRSRPVTPVSHLPVAVASERLTCKTSRVPGQVSPFVSLRVPWEQPGAVYLAFSGSLHVSHDYGRTFRLLRRSSSTGGETFQVFDFQAVPDSGGRTAVAAHVSFPRYADYTTGAPLVATNDGGATWTPVVVELPLFDAASNLAVTPTGRIVAGSWHEGLACSSDGGRTWGRSCSTPEPR